MYIVAAAYIFVIFAAEVQAIHTVRRCDSKYNNLLQQAASVHQECGDPSVYNCCSVSWLVTRYTHYNTCMLHLHTERHLAIQFRQVTNAWLAKEDTVHVHTCTLY